MKIHDKFQEINRMEKWTKAMTYLDAAWGFFDTMTAFL
jgi:hypothetical protein